MPRCTTTPNTATTDMSPATATDNAAVTTSSTPTAILDIMNSQKAPHAVPAIVNDMVHSINSLRPYIPAMIPPRYDDMPRVRMLAPCNWDILPTSTLNSVAMTEKAGTYM